MALYLDEEVFGADNRLIGFPHLLLCLGFVLIVRRGQDDGELWGIHLAAPHVSQRTFGMFANFLRNDVGILPTTMVRIYGSCNHVVRYRGNNPREAWKAEMTLFAQQLGFTGQVRGFDTSVIDPKHGTYVEYQVGRPALEQCKVFYKRDEKMEYGARGSGTDAFGIQRSDRDITELPAHLRNNPAVLAKCRDAVVPNTKTRGTARPKPKSFGRAGTLREVDNANRMWGFEV